MASTRPAPQRHSFHAKCRTQRGQHHDVEVIDLSASGCLIEKRGIAIAEGERFLIRLPGLSFLPGEVLWIEDGQAGIRLEQILHEAVFANLQRQLRGDEAA